MRISSVIVKNHSRIADCTLDVRDSLILVGSNGSGKSSLIRCLDLLLGKTTQQLYSSISASDFRDTELPFIVEATLTNLNDDELSFFPDEIDALDGSLTIRLEAKLDDEDLIVSRYCPKGLIGHTLSFSQLKSIGWNLISSDFSASSLHRGRRTIIDEYLKKIDASGDESKLLEAVKSLCGAIDESSAFNNALSSLALKLDSALTGGVKPSDLRFIPGAATDGNLLSDVRLQIKNTSGIMREATEQSDGTKALLAFAVFDLLCTGGILAIDEPETHLHPTAQRNLIRILKKAGRQLIIATHSGIVAGEFDPDNIAITREGLAPKQPQRGFLKSDQKTLTRWWISSRIELLTARCIIAVEGQSDRMLLEKVAELTGRHLERDGVEILEAGGCREMPHIMNIFGKAGFGIRLSILIDADAESNLAQELTIDPDDFASNSIFVSRSDLEDEYVSAIGADALWNELNVSTLFTPEVLRNCQTSNDNGIPNEHELAAFCRKKKNKVASAVVACNTLNSSSAQKVSSIVEVLQNVAR